MNHLYLTLGLSLISLGVLTILFGNDLLDNIIAKKFILQEDSKTYEAWVKSGVPMSLKFYFFNWTNPTNMKDPYYKPEFTELGPYTFWEKTFKVDVIWHENGTVSYNRLRRWYFDRNSSSGSIEDVITSINAVALSAAYLLRGSAVLTRVSLGVAISGFEEIATKKTVRELLFDGYDDPLLKAGKNMPGLSDRIPFERFGWFYDRNGTKESAKFNIETGSNGMENFGKVRSWNSKNETGYYETPCGSVVGSAGDFWPPKQTKTEDVVLFSPDLCRYMELKYTEEVEVHGMTTYKYEAGVNLVDDGRLDPKNGCFQKGSDLPFGVVDVRSCRHGAPTFVSYPHFYLADESYRESVVGMKPDPDMHKVYLTLEPTYGIPVDVAARIQINMLVEPDRFVKMFDGVPRVMFPIMWFEQKVTVPSERVSIIKILVKLPAIGLASAIVLIAAGLILIVGPRFIWNRGSLSIANEPTSQNGIIKEEDGKTVTNSKTDIKSSLELSVKGQYTHL